MTTTTDRTTRFVEPMLCQPVHVLPVGDAWFYEIKWDGYRAIGSKQGRESHLFSRHGKPLNRDFPQLSAELQHLRCRSALVDGEIVAWDEDGRPSFQLLRQGARARSLTFVLFDLVMLNGRELRDKPLEFRRKALASIMPRGDVSLLGVSDMLTLPASQLMDHVAEMRLEGIVAKRKDSTYEAGRRSGAWVKCRAEKRGTFVIGGYIPGPDGIGELILGEWRGDKLHFVSRLRSGFDQHVRKAILAAIEPLIQPTCPFVDLPEGEVTGWSQPQQSFDHETMQKCRWVKPRGAVDVRFAEWSETRKLRHARFAGLAGSTMVEG